jgi:hypothetical protein
MMRVAVPRKSAIASPAIGSNQAPFCHRALDEANQAGPRCVSYRRHSTPPNFGRDDDHGSNMSFPPIGFGLGTSDESLIDFDFTDQAITTGADHGAPQLVEPRPRGPITAVSEDPLESQGAHALLLARQVPDRLEPQPQRLASAFKDGPRRDRGLSSAARAAKLVSARFPSLPCTTARALKTVRPADPPQVFLASSLRGKPLVEFRHCPRVVHASRRMPGF